MKDFADWHIVKNNLENRDVQKIYFREREVWFCGCGLNVGFEQDGKGEKFARPVLVLKKFNSRIFWGVPLTTTSKVGPYYFNFQLIGHESSTAILSQIRLLDSKRLLKKIATLAEPDFAKLKTKVRELLL